MYTLEVEQQFLHLILSPFTSTHSLCLLLGPKTTKASQPGFTDVGRPAVSLQYLSSETLWFESIILQYPLRSEVPHCLAK